MFIHEEDILHLIYDKLNYKDKYNFIRINKDTYSLLSDDYKKYNLINYVNNDYLKYYELLNNHDYKNDPDFINLVIVKAFMNIPKLQPSLVVEMYDLRYVFELIYNNYCLNDKDIRLYNIHFYIHFYKKIKHCIINNDRKLTLSNIEKDSYLYSLKQNKFKNNKDWISIQK